MKKRFEELFPRYIFIPLFILMFMNFITYFASKIITDHLYHYTISTIFDDMIPLVPFFITIYILAYVQWVVGYIVIARESKKICYKYLSAELIAKFFCLIFFFVLPTTMVRPEVTNNGLLFTLVNYIYAMDAPVNLFPSIHCLESWMVFRGSMECKKVPTSYKVINFIFTVLVCLSTVFVKQHLVIDIIGGILVVEVGIFIANKYKTGIKFRRFVSKLSITKDDRNEFKKSKTI